MDIHASFISSEINYLQRFTDSNMSLAKTYQEFTNDLINTIALLDSREQSLIEGDYELIKFFLENFRNDIDMYTSEGESDNFSVLKYRIRDIEITIRSVVYDYLANPALINLRTPENLQVFKETTDNLCRSFNYFN